MIIEINPNTQLDKINQGFKNYYPFLKLEFFNKPHSWQDETSEIQLISQQKLVKEVTDLQNNGFIEIHYWQKTGTVEQLFAKRFKLFIQIYFLNELNKIFAFINVRNTSILVYIM